MINNKKVGSKLYGQHIDSIITFLPVLRLFLINPLPSEGSNYGLTNAKLKKLVDEKETQFHCI